jgi:hypothetical protein
LWLKSHLTYLSPSVASILAENLGVTTLEGKTINQHGPTPAGQTKPRLPNGLNQPITGDFDTLTNPSIAFDNAYSPTGYASGYAVYQALYLGPCQVWATTNGGSTWTYMGNLPLDSGATSCADPVVRWSPDGSTAYFVYLSVFPTYTNVDFLVDAYPPTFTPSLTETVLEAGHAGGWLYDFPWVDVHEMNNAIVNTQGKPSQASYVYVTFTYFDDSGNDIIGENSNSNYGASAYWSVSGFWNLGFGSCSGAIPPNLYDCSQVVTGARVIGGMYNTTTDGGDVLACWYNSDTTGFLNGVFDIQCDHSATNGFGAANWYSDLNGGYPTSSCTVAYHCPITVAHDVKYQLPYFLCPNDNYEEWWTGMFPSIAITPDGRAQIAFAASSYNYLGDVNSPANKVACGNIEYVRSNPFNYDHSVGSKHPSWPSSPVTVAGGSYARGFPTLVAQLRPALPPTSLGYRLYLFYYDAVNSPTTCTTPLATKCYANILYDVYMSTSDNGGASFTAATRITDQSSLANFDTVTSYLDATATSHSVWVIWPDRANQLPCATCGYPPIYPGDTDSAIYVQQVSVST